MPAWRRYFAYARSTTTCRQVSPARSTSSLKPSTSASPRQAAANAFSTWGRTSDSSRWAAGGWRPKSYRKIVPSLRRISYGRSSTTCTPSECSTGSTAESIIGSPYR